VCDREVADINPERGRRRWLPFACPSAAKHTNSTRRSHTAVTVASPFRAARAGLKRLRKKADYAVILSASWASGAPKGMKTPFTVAPAQTRVPFQATGFPPARERLQSGVLRKSAAKDLPVHVFNEILHMLRLAWQTRFFRSLFSPANAALKGGATVKLGHYQRPRELDRRQGITYGNRLFSSSLRCAARSEIMLGPPHGVAGATRRPAGRPNFCRRCQQISKRDFHVQRQIRAGD